MAFITLRGYPGRENVAAIRLLSLDDEGVLVPTELSEVTKMELLFENGIVVSSVTDPDVFDWEFYIIPVGTISTSNYEAGTYIWGDLTEEVDYNKIDIGAHLNIRIATSPDIYQSCKVNTLLGYQSGTDTWRVQFDEGTTSQVTDEIFRISAPDHVGRVELYLGRAPEGLDGAEIACLVVYPQAYPNGVTWGNLRIIYGGCGIN